MISDAYELCRTAIKRINGILDTDNSSAPDVKLLQKALVRKLGALRELIINYELGYSMDKEAYEILRELDRLLGIGK
jgi:hypothetical protein